MQLKFSFQNICNNGYLPGAISWESPKLSRYSTSTPQQVGQGSNVDIISHLHFSFTDEFEERVSPAFVRKIQGRLQVMISDAKSRNVMIHSKERAMEEAKNQVTLLMDTKFSFAVRFPFNPSNINFAELEVKFEILHTEILNLNPQVPELYNNLPSLVRKV